MMPSSYFNQVEYMEKPTHYAHKWSNGWGVTYCVNCGTNCPLDYATGLCETCKQDKKVYNNAKRVAEMLEELGV